jgi:hypothetical protein
MQIDLFSSGALGLRFLIQDLIFLRDELLNANDDWERQFNDYVLDLESAYSYALEKNSGKLDTMTKKIVDNSLANLLRLIPVQEPFMPRTAGKNHPS